MGGWTMVFRSLSIMGLALLMIACSAEGTQGTQGTEGTATTGEEPQMKINSITSVLLANELEPCVIFWESLGFEVAISVPFDNKLAFVSLQNGPLEIMYQSFDFSRATNPIGIDGVNRSVVFMETDALDEIIPVIEKYDVVIPDHITNRGSREIYVRDPAGNLIGFAQNNP